MKSPAVSAAPPSSAFSVIDAVPSVADSFISEAAPTQPERVGKSSTLRAMTEPARRILPGHKRRHEQRQAVHRQIFAALDFSRAANKAALQSSRPFDTEAVRAWRAVVNACARESISLTSQLRRCSEGAHIVETLLKVEDYASLSVLLPYLDAATYGKPNVRKFEVENGVYLGETTGTFNVKRHGRGLLLKNNAYSYYGQWANDIMSGEGGGFDNRNNYHYGCFSNDRLYGEGVTGNAQYEYRGRWSKNYWTGDGVLTFKDGTVVKGQWDGEKGTVREATIQLKDGSRYEGGRVGTTGAEWKTRSSWLFHDKGKLTQPDGSVYVGEFRRGQRHGKGEYAFGPKDYHFGYRFEGDFVDDQPTGHGLLRNILTGDASFCFYKDGELITRAAPELDLLPRAPKAD